VGAGVLLALASAAAFGVCDFAAGLAARRTAFLWVTVLSLIASSSGAWVVVFVMQDQPRPVAVAWGCAAGLGAAVGATALYAGYGSGRMAVAGPLSAVGAAALPAGLGALLGERMPVPGVAGLLVALPAIWLMSSAGGHDDSEGVRAGVPQGLLSGTGFALEFVGLDRAGDAAGLWPVAVSQTTALILVAVLLVARRPSRKGSRGPLVLALTAGVLSLTATALYFLAAHAGSLTVAAVVTSLYPGVTVVLAAVLLREAIDRRQTAGLLLGAVAVVLITIG
jgi:drug/metabolite transporter (DMT)-like permease